MEKKKMKLLGQNKPMTAPQVPKSATTVSLASPKPLPKINPRAPAVEQPQDVRAKVPNRCGDSENDREIPSAKCARIDSTPNDCMKVDALKEMQEKDACKDNNITGDTEDINCKPVETASMQKVRTNYLCITKQLVCGYLLIRFCFYRLT